MKHVLTKKTVKYLLKGSSFFSTGGGIEMSTQEKLFDKLFGMKKKLEYISFSDLSETDYVCTAYAVGSAGDTSFDLSESLKIGLRELENITGKTFSALFVGETNAEVLAFQAASSLKIPVLDADGAGGRAVPEIKQDNFAVKGRSVLPLIAVTPDKKIIKILIAKNGEEIENKVRNLSKKYKKGLIAVIDHPIQIKKTKGLLTLGIITRSIGLGILLTQKKTQLQDIISETRTNKIIDGTLVEKNLISHNGFLEGNVVIESKGKKAIVYIKNENILCTMNGKVVASSPDPIYLFDKTKKIGIHNSKSEIGQQVVVLTKKAVRLWRTKKGKELFNPESLGISIEK